jgi:hypothetical protein
MKVAGKEVVKQLLGEVPFTAELYWLLRQRGKPLQSRFSLRHLQAEMPELVKQAQRTPQRLHQAAKCLSLRPCITGSSTARCWVLRWLPRDTGLPWGICPMQSGRRNQPL